jgi:hypothetical protein
LRRRRQRALHGSVFADMALRYVSSAQYAPILFDGNAVTALCRFHVTFELKG